MPENQLFYLTIMLALLVLYLIVSKICETFETKYKAKAMENMKTIDLSNNEEAREKLIEILQSQENKNGGDY